VVVVAPFVVVVAPFVVVVVLDVSLRGGRVALTSCVPSVPTGRPNGWPVWTSTTMITVICCGAGVTTCVVVGEKPVHCGPVYCGLDFTGSGSTSGLPQ
jgi:hypothetical protein